MDNIDKIVKNLVQKHKTNDPYELADKLNMIVVKKTIDKNTKGFYQYFQRNKIIYINNLLPEHEQRIVCSHELGHAIMHPTLNILFLQRNTYFVKSKFEKEANKFAAELLIPDTLLQQHSNYTLEQIAAIEYLPIELLKLKFNIECF